MKITERETYEATLAYAKYKATAKFWKIILLGFMAGVFVGLGYIGAFAMKSLPGDQTMAKFLAAGIFPTGIIMIVFLGGSLFTSDSLSLLPVIEKQVKPLTALKGLGLVLLGNALGMLVISAITYWSGFMNPARLNILQHYIDAKQDKEWYAIFFSGMITNIIVAGSVWMSLSTKSAAGKVLLLWFPITLFAAAGFEHIVANFFIFWTGVLANGDTYKDAHGVVHTLTCDGWKFLYNNLLVTTVANWVGSSLLIVLPYYFLYGYKHQASK